jgi:uncharacterized protein VirK/YbjX
MFNYLYIITKRETRQFMTILNNNSILLYLITQHTTLYKTF